MMTWIRKSLVLLTIVCLAKLAQASEGDPWGPYRCLLGEWEGEGSGQPGKGSGGFTFALDLSGKVLVRRNHSEYPAAGGRPAVVHDDLMVVYPEASGKTLKAEYFDNEGHVIHYTVTAGDDGKTLTFVSGAAAPGPRFRLTYTKVEADRVGIKFEIAPPGKPDGFRTYLEGKARKKSAGAGTGKEEKKNQRSNRDPQKQEPASTLGALHELSHPAVAGNPDLPAPGPGGRSCLLSGPHGRLRQL
jgi:hypothetical protein